MTHTGFEAIETAKVNGTTLAYREEGTGEPVVFVHGSISDLRVWDAQVPVIGASYRAVAYSRRYARPNEDIEPESTTRSCPTWTTWSRFFSRSMPHPRTWSGTRGVRSSAC